MFLGRKIKNYRKIKQEEKKAKMFIANELYIDEKADFQLFFDIITLAIDADLRIFVKYSYL